jgi:uncharacterized 2Fe-2S/4Fe-4S cluster protein (DUF4445 family)
MKMKTVSLMLLLLISASTLSYAVAYQYHFVSDKKQISACLRIRPLEATVDMEPETLYLKAKGKWITAYIELPEGWHVEDIDISTILLNGTVGAVTDPKYAFVTNSSEYITDNDGDGILERMVKFDRKDVTEYLKAKGIINAEVNLTITGKVNGTPFEGTDTIRIKDE